MRSLIQSFGVFATFSLLSSECLLVTYRGVPLALVSEIFHEMSKLFRTANESRAKEREKQPTAKHDENQTVAEVINAGAGVVPGGRIRVCLQVS